MIEIVLSVVVTSALFWIGLMELLARRGVAVSKVPDLADSFLPVAGLLLFCAVAGNFLIWLPRLMGW